jgi:beta-lactamase class A
MGVLLTVPALGACLSQAAERVTATADARLAALEGAVRGRLGVAALNLSTGRRVEYRSHERFAMCSTFKLPLVAMVIQKADAGRDSLDRRIVLTEKDFVSHAPVTRHHLGPPGITLGELCEAAIVYSDGTAANVLLATAGGPAGFTAWIRAFGDRMTRLDRIEMDLNEAAPGDVRDTTTPASMLEDARKIVFGDALSAASRSLLTGWMIAERIGEKRLRSGFPQHWRMGDKPGTGGNGTVNDVAAIWRPNGEALVVAAYLTETSVGLTGCESVLAEVGKVILSVL